MERIVTGGQMKELDSFTIHEIGIPSLVLMERAGLSVYRAMREQGLPLERNLVWCGCGNNGADGVVIARLLHLAGYETEVCILGNPEHYTKEMEKQIEIGKKYGISFVNTFDLNEYTTIVDAIFGVGLSREVAGKYREIIENINASGKKVVSVDIPSGISADTGQILGTAVQADLTVTFAYKKAGLCFYPGALYGGRILTEDIGIFSHPAVRHREEIRLMAWEAGDLQQIQRTPQGNKGTYGKIFLAAGSRNTFGAAYLSGYSAMKTGAGMLKICTHRENKPQFSCFPEAMLQTYAEGEDMEEALGQSLEWADVYGIGPGLGTNAQAEALLELILKNGKKPLVIDADGINLLKGREELLKAYQAPVILTPHLGELARLTGLTPREFHLNPAKHTRELAKKLHAVLVCKDARTTISNGDEKVFINLTGNDGMATAGSGDVLAGIILGLLAQGLPALEAAGLGVYLHGAGGDLAAKEKGRAGLLARDIAEAVALILKGQQEKRELL